MEKMKHQMQSCQNFKITHFKLYDLDNYCKGVASFWQIFTNRPSSEPPSERMRPDTIIDYLHRFPQAVISYLEYLIFQKKLEVILNIVYIQDVKFCINWYIEIDIDLLWSNDLQIHVHV